MIFNLKNPYEHQAFREYVDKAIKQERVIEVKYHYPNRSRSQNSYLHLLLGWFGSRFGYSLDEVKDLYFKKTCNLDLFHKVVTDKFTGEVTETWKSTAELTTAEMTLAIDRFRNWSSAVAGLYLPQANEYGYITSIEQDLAKEKEYIVIPE